MTPRAAARRMAALRSSERASAGMPAQPNDKRGTVAAEVTLAKWGNGYIANEIWIADRPYAVEVNKDADGAVRLVLIHHYTMHIPELDQEDTNNALRSG